MIEIMPENAISINSGYDPIFQTKKGNFWNKLPVFIKKHAVIR